MNEVGALTVKCLRCSELYRMSEKEWNEKMLWGNKSFEKRGHVR